MADLNFAEYVAGLVEKARKAQAIANNFTQEDVDLITAAVTYNLTKPDNSRHRPQQHSGTFLPIQFFLLIHRQSAMLSHTDQLLRFL